MYNPLLWLKSFDGKQFPMIILWLQIIHAGQIVVCFEQERDFNDFLKGFMCDYQGQFFIFLVSFACHCNDSVNKVAQQKTQRRQLRRWRRKRRDSSHPCATLICDSDLVISITINTDAYYFGRRQM